jgi:hypothetical protein
MQQITWFVSRLDLHIEMLTDDDNISYNIDELLNDLQMFIADKTSESYLLSRWQAMLLVSEIMSLVEDVQT